MTIRSFIGIGAAVLILVLTGLWYSEHNAKLKERAEKERLERNQEQLLNENAEYRKVTLTDDEFKKAITRKVDSLLKEMKLKPKFVTNVIENHYYHGDTSSHTLPTTPQTYDGYKVYTFNDTASCFKIGGFVRTFLTGDPLVTINQRKFNNESTQIDYIRRSHKFLGIIPYGPWKGEAQIFNTCGTTETREIIVLKKKRFQINK
jgi:hypothetical protein